MRFKNYINDLSKLEKKIKNKRVKIYNNKILSETDKYIQSITTYDYYALPQFHSVTIKLFKKKIL